MNHSTTARRVSRGIRLSVIIGLLALLTGILAVTQTARALTYVVTNSNNSGDGSLRKAINDANSSPGADIITFNTSTNGNPIVLAGTAGENVNAGGDLDILGAGGDLIVEGRGAGITIIDGGGIDRVFHVCPGGGCDNTVTFSGVTIQNGSDLLGGGIYNYDATTKVTNSTVSGNTALGGGGIYNNGTMTLDGSSVAANSATVLGKVGGAGGGIYNKVTLIVRNGSSIGGTSASNTATKFGGGIYNESGTTTVDGSSVSYNISDNGGGIYNEAGVTTVDGSTVSSNSASSYGGGIYNKVTLTIQNGSTIGRTGAGNTAKQGGGIFNDAGTMTLDDSTVSGNTASDYGGGIYHRFGTAILDGSTVNANTADDSGGGIFNKGTMTVDDSTVSDNSAEYLGGGIKNSGTLVVKNGSTISDNTAYMDGGGIHNYGATTVTGSRILNNTASFGGGGVFNTSSTAGATSVTSSCIAGNSDSSYYNYQPAQQIATINWWGAAGGPGAPGADTVHGNVNVSGALSDPPILGCGPDLQVGKSNDTGGKGVVGTIFHWTLAVRNSGPTRATFESGQVILKDELPAGPTYGAPAAGSFVDVTNGANIQCSVAGNTLTCEATDQDVIIATSGSFEVALPVTPGSTATLTNPAGICKVDPDGNVPENDESNNECPEDVVFVLGLPDLQVDKSNDTGGMGEVGTAFDWTLTVRNTGGSRATFGSGERILVDELPAGPNYGAPVTSNFVEVSIGENIQCSIASGDTLTCTADGGDVSLGDHVGSFDVTFPVTPGTPGTLTNPAGICKVDPDGKVTEGDEGNNECPENVVKVGGGSGRYLYLPVVLK